MSLPARLAIALIGLYRRYLSPLFPRSCRYEPTCSAYALGAIRAHGFVRGGFMAVRRISRCHPFKSGGLDPVPDRKVA